jgi:hypothetical protein
MLTITPLRVSPCSDSQSTCMIISPGPGKTETCAEETSELAHYSIQGHKVRAEPSLHASSCASPSRFICSQGKVIVVHANDRKVQ